MYKTKWKQKKKLSIKNPPNTNQAKISMFKPEKQRKQIKYNNNFL